MYSMKATPSDKETDVFSKKEDNNESNDSTQNFQQVAPNISIENIDDFSKSYFRTYMLIHLLKTS